MPSLSKVRLEVQQPFDSVELQATLDDDRELKATLGLYRPSRLHAVMFMHNAHSCPVCELQHGLAHAHPARRLHVVVSGDLLVVTEADDLYVPGRIVCGRRLLELAGVTMYRLLETPPTGVEPLHHVAAQGIAVLSRSYAQWHLRVTGRAAGSASVHTCIFDAVESRIASDNF